MGEHGEENLQSNLESFINLKNLNNFIDSKKSIISNSRLKEKNEKNKIKKPSNKFKSSSSLKIDGKIEEPDFEISEFNSSNLKNNIFINKKDKELEKVLKKEEKRRKNPLNILSNYIKRIKELCKRLETV